MGWNHRGESELSPCREARADPPEVNFETKFRKEQAMNWDRIEGNWKQFKGQVRQQWGKLTDDDMEFVEGKRTELAGRIQQRYGVARDQAEREIDTWLKSMH
jgi:uncharacterized protein YjbJ (UPF0337 family)